MAGTSVGTLRQVLLRCAASALGLVVAVALAETLLRLLGLAPTDGVATVTEAQFRSVPGMLLPHQHLVDRRDPRLPHYVTTNALGYRGSEFPLPKRAGEFRILFTGDSFAYGDFVNDDQTLPAQLEQRLNGRCGAVRVVNAGLDDATIVDEANVIDRGLRVSPDLVIVLFSENDIDDLNRPPTWDRLAENRRSKSRFPLSVLYPVLRHTALWNLALHVRAASRASEHTVKIDWTAAGQGDSATPRLRNAYRRALAAVRDTLRARGIPMVLVTYPSHHSLKQEALRGQLTWVARASAETNVPVIELLGPLAASRLPVEALYLLPYDGHPSAHGLEIAAAYIADRLAAHGPLVSPCQTVVAGSPARARASSSATR